MTASGGAREQAAALRARVGEETAQAVHAATVPLGEVYIGWTAAADAATCPVRYRAGGETGWAFPGWSPMLAAGAVGRAALAHHLHVHDHRGGPAGGGRAPLPDPAGTIRGWMRAASKRESRPPVGGWVAELMASGDPEAKATLAATAAYASRWLGGFVRVLGWPLPDHLGIVADDGDNPLALRWSKTHRPGGSARNDSDVVIRSTPDAVLGRLSPTGDHALVLHRPTTRGDAELSDRAAFEAVAASLTTGVVPGKVLLTTGDTGEKLHVPTDEAQLRRGVELMVEVVRQRTVASSGMEPGTDSRRPSSEPDAVDEADATPSPACHSCDHLDRCPPGRAWLQGPGRWLAGLPLVASRQG